MNRIIIIILLALSSISLIAQNTRDVVYLKNGSIIKGTITEMNPSSNLKIKIADGSLFVYEMTDILKMEKEEFVGEDLNLNQTKSIVNELAVFEYFDSYFKKDKPLLKLVDAIKTNGIKRNFFGQEIYQIEYELIIEARQTIYISWGFVSSKYDKGKFRYETKDTYNNYKIFQKGNRLVSRGTIDFEETDNGWRVVGYDNSNYSIKTPNYMSPDMQKKYEETQAKKLVALKSELDWQKPDIEPVAFEPRYYSSLNVPYFHYGDSRYYLKPSKLFKGRNDVCRSIQNVFYQAIEGTNRSKNSNESTYASSDNNGAVDFSINKVDFLFLETGYQCKIYLSAMVKGKYTNPETYPFSYRVKVEAQSSPNNQNLSKDQAFGLALKNLKLKLRNFIFKHEPISLNLIRIEKNKRGKVSNVVFEKPSDFFNINKLDFIVINPDDLSIEENTFKVKSKVGDCTFKGEIKGNEIICQVSGNKNKKAFEDIVDSASEFIGISTFQ